MAAAAGAGSTGTLLPPAHIDGGGGDGDGGGGDGDGDGDGGGGEAPVCRDVLLTRLLQCMATCGRCTCELTAFDSDCPVCRAAMGAAINIYGEQRGMGGWLGCCPRVEYFFYRLKQSNEAFVDYDTNGMERGPFRWPVGFEDFDARWPPHEAAATNFEGSESESEADPCDTLATVAAPGILEVDDVVEEDAPSSADTDDFLNDDFMESSDDGDAGDVGATAADGPPEQVIGGDGDSDGDSD
jgi:hypothetical protein